LRLGLATGVLLAAAAAAGLWSWTILPRDGCVAIGTRAGGTPAPAAIPPRTFAEQRAHEILHRRWSLSWEGHEVTRVSLAELGATIDVHKLAERLDQVGREGDLFARLDDALLARRGQVDVPVPIALPIEALAGLLDRFKEEHDDLGRGSKLDLSSRQPTAHVPGRFLDVYAAAASLERAIDSDRSDIDLPSYEILPRASSDVVAQIDISHVVSSYETRFGYFGGQAGRAQNIARAAGQIAGTVLMPGDVVSFNHQVGPRSTDNGFTTAPEIYKGEMREGIGGGTCQVSGTLHAAAYLGGLEVVERSNHSRPSGYLRPGLDATVVFPTVDLKLRNPFPFPVVIDTKAEKGTLKIALLGREPAPVVEFATATVGIADYKRKVEEAPWLTDGHFVLKQRGIRGLSIRKTRVIHARSDKPLVEVTTDVYPPTLELYLIAPGTDPDAILPPLPGSDPPPSSG
jgi:vancomycin resistance protein YoaR